MYLAVLTLTTIIHFASYLKNKILHPKGFVAATASFATSKTLPTPMN